MSKFRKVCRWLHRELGYFAVGLTLVYAISGIAVNHVKDWDPNRSLTVQAWRIEAPGNGPTAEIEPRVMSRLDLDATVKSTWRAGPDLLQIFIENGEIDVNLLTGDVEQRTFRKRPLLFDMNFMHLNTGKGAWTVVADVYAGVLIILGLSGIFLVKGRRGLAGRGGLLMFLGVLLPVVYALLIRG